MAWLEGSRRLAASLRVGQKLLEWEAKRLCNALDAINANIALATLNRRDVGAMQLRQLRELLLRYTQLLATRPHIVREQASGLGHLRACTHASSMGNCTL